MQKKSRASLDVSCQNEWSKNTFYRSLRCNSAHFVQKYLGISLTSFVYSYWRNGPIISIDTVLVIHSTFCILSFSFRNWGSRPLTKMEIEVAQSITVVLLDSRNEANLSWWRTGWSMWWLQIKTRTEYAYNCGVQVNQYWKRQLRSGKERKMVEMKHSNVYSWSGIRWAWVCFMSFCTFRTNWGHRWV